MWKGKLPNSGVVEKLPIVLVSKGRPLFLRSVARRAGGSGLCRSRVRRGRRGARSARPHLEVGRRVSCQRWRGGMGSAAQAWKCGCHRDARGLANALGATEYIRGVAYLAGQAGKSNKKTQLAPTRRIRCVGHRPPRLLKKQHTLVHPNPTQTQLASTRLIRWATDPPGL